MCVPEQWTVTRSRCRLNHYLSAWSLNEVVFALLSLSGGAERYIRPVGGAVVGVVPPTPRGLVTEL